MADHITLHFEGSSVEYAPVANQGLPEGEEGSKYVATYVGRLGVIRQRGFRNLRDLAGANETTPPTVSKYLDSGAPWVLENNTVVYFEKNMDYRAGGSSSDA